MASEKQKINYFLNLKKKTIPSRLHYMQRQVAMIANVFCNQKQESNYQNIISYSFLDHKSRKAWIRQIKLSVFKLINNKTLQMITYVL